MLSSFNSFLLSSIQLFPPFFRPPFRAFIHPPHAPHHASFLHPSFLPTFLSSCSFFHPILPPPPFLPSFHVSFLPSLVLSHPNHSSFYLPINTIPDLNQLIKPHKSIFTVTFFIVLEVRSESTFIPNSSG